MAALTIPSIITNYQHTQYITSLKKMQSVLNKAAYTYIANGNIIDCDLYGETLGKADGKFNSADTSISSAYSKGTFAEEPVFFKKFRENLETIKAPDNEKLSNIPVYNINGEDIGVIGNYINSVFLKDGMTYKINATSYAVGNKIPSNYCLNFFVDVNGPFKKPNKIGYDVFGFLMSRNGQVIPAGADIQGARDSYKTDCVDIGRTLNKSWCMTSSALKGKNPDGTEYWKGIKYWENIN